MDEYYFAIFGFCVKTKSVFAIRASAKNTIPNKLLQEKFAFLMQQVLLFSSSDWVIVRLFRISHEFSNPDISEETIL